MANIWLQNYAKSQLKQAPIIETCRCPGTCCKKSQYKQPKTIEWDIIKSPVSTTWIKLRLETI